MDAKIHGQSSKLTANNILFQLADNHFLMFNDTDDPFLLTQVRLRTSTGAKTANLGRPFKWQRLIFSVISFGDHNESASTAIL